MEAITERDIRASFVNCSKGEAKRLGLPKDFAELPWPDLDFLGWRDPGAPERAYLVSQGEGGLVGIALGSGNGGRSGNFTQRSMCSLCLSTHTAGGVALMTARRAGEAGRQGNTVGAYICADLACSLYLRGKKQAMADGPEESLTTEEKAARTMVNLAGFLDKVLTS
ncbi:FBP domain-containing protein [Nonomuraea sp. NPDC050556]|uniref:FBP domain-containing protein n=1 Tax=Nonomuraea sp. NPDC050556 TaxID=3364369 RepID=UPI0037A99691